MTMKSIILSIVLGLAWAKGDALPYALHEKRHRLHPRWTKSQELHPASILPVRIGLVQQNIDIAHEYLLDVSDPESANYGRHWSAKKVIETFQPSSESVQAVQGWLVAAGVDAKRITHSDNKLWLAFDATAREAGNLFQTKYYEYEDAISGHRLPACDEYHLPEDIRDFVDYVTPGIKLLAPTIPKRTRDRRAQSKRRALKPPRKLIPDPHAWLKNSSSLSTCDQTITPACVAALYQIPERYGRNVTVNPNNTLGIYESELEYWDQLDLNLFFTNFTKYIMNNTHPLSAGIDGGVPQTFNVSEAGGEAMLDLELAYPIVYPQTITVYQEDDANYEANPNQTYTGGFNHLLDAIDGSYCTYSAFGETGDDPNIDPKYPDPAPGGYKGQLQCGVYKPPNVISISYGGQEADVPWAYQKRQCNEYLKLGLQGVSFLFASGDAGVGNYPAPYGGDGPTGCLGPEGNIFNPTWPNNCPWITNVGATKVYPGFTVFQPESAVYDPAGHPYHVNYSSGGGFSNIYEVPAYQQAAVSAFFTDHNPTYPSYSAIVNDTSLIDSLGANGGIYNRIGRGIPDVAANGDNIAVYVGGVFGRSGGTSASTPIFSGIVNRLNEERLAAGKSVVGFLNPVLYKHPEIFNDITNGTNPGCGTIGFSAVKGWDPVTGLGTPNYPKMSSLFKSLP